MLRSGNRAWCNRSTRAAARSGGSILRPARTPPRSSRPAASMFSRRRMARRLSSPTLETLGERPMPYTMKPLGCDPARVKGMSERLIVSHYENNYGGAVKRLNLIEEQLAGLDYDKAANFVINGLKREQLVAMNSMVLHELFFDGLGEESEPGMALREALAKDFGSYERWRSEFAAMGK